MVMPTACETSSVLRKRQGSPLMVASVSDPPPLFNNDARPPSAGVFSPDACPVTAWTFSMTLCPTYITPATAATPPTATTATAAIPTLSNAFDFAGAAAVLGTLVAPGCGGTCC